MRSSWLHDCFDHVYTLFAVRILWRSKTIRTEAIRGFQSVEADGVWHLYQTIPKIEDSKIRAHTFTHLIEEESHADLFTKAYEAESGTYFKKKFIERRRLFDHSAPIWKSLAYVHVGEVDATKRFQRIVKFLPEGHLRHSLVTIIRDEMGHVDLTENELIKLGVPPEEVQKQLFSIRWQRFSEVWVSTGRSGGEKISNLILSLVYFTILPFVAFAARKKMSRETVDYDNNHLKKFV